MSARAMAGSDVKVVGQDAVDIGQQDRLGEAVDCVAIRNGTQPSESDVSMHAHEGGEASRNGADGRLVPEYVLSVLIIVAVRLVVLACCEDAVETCALKVPPGREAGTLRKRKPMQKRGEQEQYATGHLSALHSFATLRHCKKASDEIQGDLQVVWEGDLQLGWPGHSKQPLYASLPRRLHIFPISSSVVPAAPQEKWIFLGKWKKCGSGAAQLCRETQRGGSADAARRRRITLQQSGRRRQLQSTPFLPLQPALRIFASLPPPSALQLDAAQLQAQGSVGSADQLRARVHDQTLARPSSHRASVRAHNNKVGSPPSLADSAPSRRVRGVVQHTSVGADHAAEAEELLLRASGAAASASRQNGPTFMSTGGTHSHHAETSASNVSGSHHSGAENGHDAPAAGTNGDASHAETSRQGSTSGERSVSPRNEAMPAAPVKRKRLAAELAFSSPGPAFQLQKDAEADEQQTSDTPGRARRPRRSTTLNGGGTSSLTSNRRASQSRPQQVSASLRDEEPFDAKPRLTPTISPKPYANEADLDAPNETTRIGTEAGPIASTSSSQSDRSRSRSRSAFQQDESETHSFSDQGQAESPAKPPLPLRTRPQITPIAAHDAATPLPQILERRRHEKVAVAQSDLEEVHDRHDMLVRELFHLTKFVTMVGYDPDEARNDQSDVFTTFKHAHDLRFSLDDAGSGAEASGSGRVTRRRVNARLESLSLKRPPPPTSPATRATSAKNGSKRRSSDRFPGRASSSTAEPEARGSTADASEGATSDDNSQDEDEISDMSDSQAASRRAGKQKSSRGRSKGKQKQSRTTAPSRKRQSSFADDSFDTPAKRSSGARKSKALDELDAFILRHQPRPLPEQAPPLHILAPHQVPALKRFGGDINALWTSFDLLRDGEGGRDPAEVEAEDLQTYLRRDQRWRAGLPIHPESGGIARHVPAKAARTTKSHHDHLLDAVAASYQPMRQYAKSRQQNARRLARMVAQHWERQLGSSEREKKAEEKRIRALAKWTLREVLKQWRLAVNVVRARKAAAEKAEKEKLDKEQLNAILEQSTAMLKKQHQVMTTNADGFSDSDMDGNSDRTSYGSDDSTEAAESEDEASDADPDADVDEGIDARDGSEPATVEALPATIAEVDAIDDATSATGASTPAAAETQPSPVHAPASSRPQRSSRRTRGAARPTAAQQARAAAKLEADDVEFAVAGADDAEEEDAELERQMWEEDEEDDSEDAGLAADANIPIEELLKRYGYGASPEEAESEDNDNQADAGASTANQSDREPDEQMPDVEDVKGEEATDEDKDTEASDEETPTKEDRSASLALLRQADESADELSDAESVATGGRRGSRRSMTRASSIVSSDRAVTRRLGPASRRGSDQCDAQLGSRVQEVPSRVQDPLVLRQSEGAQGEANRLEYREQLQRVHHQLPTRSGRPAHLPPQAVGVPGARRGAPHQELSVTTLADAARLQLAAAPAAHGNSAAEQPHGSVVAHVLSHAARSQRAAGRRSLRQHEGLSRLVLQPARQGHRGRQQHERRDPRHGAEAACRAAAVPAATTQERDAREPGERQLPQHHQLSDAAPKGVQSPGPVRGATDRDELCHVALGRGRLRDQRSARAARAAARGCVGQGRPGCDELSVYRPRGASDGDRVARLAPAECGQEAAVLRRRGGRAAGA
ncbi:hypothetical protein L1887_54238 [Cichorium endivia]|nr:hypothetical protein L1887_54238 [Cichorium endivia]